MKSRRSSSPLVRRLSYLALSLTLGLLLSILTAWCFAIWEAPGALVAQPFLIGATPDGRGYEVSRSQGFGVAAAQIYAGVANPEAKLPPQIMPQTSFRSATQPPMHFGVVAADVLLPHWSATQGVLRSGGLVPTEIAGPRSQRQYITVNGITFVLNHFVEEQAAGWPRLCLRSRSDATGKMHHAIVIFKPTAPVAPGKRTFALPLQPIWGSLLLNTLFYAVPFIAFFFGYAPARRLIRHWRGRCPSCNYNLRHCEEPGCPECGWERSVHHRGRES